MNTEISVDLTNKGIKIDIKPRQYYNPAALVIEAHSDILTIQLTEDQLSVISEEIRDYLQSKGYYDSPDQQQILNAEHESEGAGWSQT